MNATTATAPSMSKRSTRRNRGQGMTEYIIIVSLIAIASIGVVTVFGRNVRELYAAAARSIAGDTESANNGKKDIKVEAKTLGNVGLKNGEEG